MAHHALPSTPPTDTRLTALLDTRARAALRIDGRTCRTVEHAIKALMDSPRPETVSFADTVHTAEVTAWISGYHDTMLDVVRSFHSAGKRVWARDLAVRLWLLAPQDLPPRWAQALLATVTDSATPPGLLAEQRELAARWYSAADEPASAWECHDRGHAVLRELADTTGDTTRVVAHLWRGVRRFHRRRRPRWALECLSRLTDELARRPDRHQNGLRLTAAGEILLECGRPDKAVEAFTLALHALDHPDVQDLLARADAEIGLGHALLGIGQGAARARDRWTNAHALLQRALGHRADIEPEPDAAAIPGSDPRELRLRYVYGLLSTPSGQAPARRPDLTLLGAPYRPPDTGHDR